jgi:hypothetical protein
MSRTNGEIGAASRCTCPLPSGFLNELDENLRSINEILQALQLFETILDPAVSGGRPIIEIYRDDLSAWLSILNSAFLTRLSAAQTAVTHAMQ